MHNGLPVQAVRSAIGNVLPDQVAETVNVCELRPKNLVSAQEESRSFTHPLLSVFVDD